MTHSSHESVHNPSAPEAIMLGSELQEWNERTDALIAAGARIITFRGAGTINGIEPKAAEDATAMLHDYVKGLRAEGIPVALMFDGDEDNRAKPDVGSVYGSLADSLSDDEGVVAIAAQTKSWYYPKAEGGNLETATGNPYETFVFEDDLPGGHASLTQSQKLVDYAGYEQVFIGPAGPIAFDQLKDLSSKASVRPEDNDPVRVTILPTANNPAITDELSAKIAISDDATSEKLHAKIIQRQTQPFGALCTPTGEFAVDPAQYPGLRLSVREIPQA